jgi:hypothetical protein
MAYYRLYFTNGGGRIFDFAEIDAGSDAEAIEVAEARRGSQAAQLWRGSHKVTAFDEARQKQAAN